MRCYRPARPDEIIIIEAGGKGAQLIYDLVTKAVNDLKNRGMETVIQKSNAIGKIPLYSKKQGEIWVEPHDWFVFGFVLLEK